MKPTPTDIRTRFREFAGEEKYKDFLVQIHRFARHRERLRFWQQALWKEFVTDNPDCEMTHEELCAVFNVCELHGLELKSKLVPVFDGCIDNAREYEIDMTQRFPHASRDIVSTEGGPKESDQAKIWYCEECDQVRETTRWRIKGH